MLCVFAIWPCLFVFLPIHGCSVCGASACVSYRLSMMSLSFRKKRLPLMLPCGHVFCEDCIMTCVGTCTLHQHSLPGSCGKMSCCLLQQCPVYGSDPSISAPVWLQCTINAAHVVSLVGGWSRPTRALFAVFACALKMPMWMWRTAQPLPPTPLPCPSTSPSRFWMRLLSALAAFNGACPSTDLLFVPHQPLPLPPNNHFRHTQKPLQYLQHASVPSARITTQHCV